MGNMKKQTLIFAALALLIAVSSIFTLQGCAKKEKVIKIGAILPLTGPAAEFGEQMKKGIIIAQEYWNNSHKITKIKFYFEDDQATPRLAIQAFQKLTMQKIKFFYTTLSPVSLTLKPLVRNKNILLFADASHPDITDSLTYNIFRHSNTAYQESKLIGSFIANKFSKSKIFLLAVNDDYGIAFTNALEKMINAKENQIFILGKMLYNKNTTNFRNIAYRVIEQKPDIIVIADLGKRLGLLIKSLRENGFKGTIVATLGLTLGGALKVADDATINSFHTQLEFNREDSFFIKISELYKHRFQEEMPNFSILSFNSILLMAEAIKNGNGDPIKACKWIHSLKEFKGAGEKMEITKYGDILPTLKIERTR